MHSGLGTWVSFEDDILEVWETEVKADYRVLAQASQRMALTGVSWGFYGWSRLRDDGVL